MSFDMRCILDPAISGSILQILTMPMYILCVNIHIQLIQNRPKLNSKTQIRQSLPWHHIFKMKDQNEGDRSLRKSNRQRVPNSFYTEGINELKKQPRPPREVGKPNRKKSKVYQESEDASYLNDYVEENRSDLNRDSGAWYPCKLPKNGNTVKVQFVLGPSESSFNPIKKQEPVSVPSKKIETSPDLLSLFQRAIQNVNEQEPIPKPSEEYPPREVRLKPQPVPKPRKAQDLDGKITNLYRTEDKLIITHTKQGESIFSDYHIQMQMQGSSESEEEGIDMELVEDYRQKITNCPSYTQLSLFN